MGDGWLASGHRLAIHRLLSALLVRSVGMEGRHCAIMGAREAGLHYMGRGPAGRVECEAHGLVQSLAEPIGYASVG